MADLINERDLTFQLYEVLDTESLLQRDTFADHDRATFDAVLDTARRVALEYFAPHNRKGDIQEPTLIDGKVHIIPEVKQAVDAFIEAGFLTAHHPAELGGIQLPITIHQACFTYFLKDVTPLAHAIHDKVKRNNLDAAKALLTRERPFPVTDHIAARLLMNHDGGMVKPPGRTVKSLGGNHAHMDTASPRIRSR